MVQAYDEQFYQQQQQQQQYQTTPSLTTRQAALLALKSDLSVVPIAADGTKKPLLSWSRFIKEAATPFEVSGWFSKWPDAGIAVIGGAVSGNLEILDFDKAEEWNRFVGAARSAGLLGLVRRIAQGYMERSPKGRHLLYRCQEPVEGNHPLARCLKVDSKGQPVMNGGKQELQILIETRGEGGYVIVAPSAGGVHPTGKPYQKLTGGFATIETITVQERQALLSLARSLDRLPHDAEEEAKERHTARKVTRPGVTVTGPDKNRPGDDFNKRGASWDEILKPAGWKFLRRRGLTEYWQRPGKARGEGWSATVNHRGTDLLYVFSSATGFDAPKAYTKFSAYAVLNHNGDFRAAAKDLAGRGYGSPRESDGSGNSDSYPSFGNEDDKEGDTEQGQAGRTARGRRRKTRQVEFEAEGEHSETGQEGKAEEPAVELEEARQILAEVASARYFSSNAQKGRTAFLNPKLGSHEVLQVATQPGTGKGFAFNEEATRQVERTGGKYTTAWFSPRLAMYGDQDRPDSTWKLVEGRKAGKDSAGNPVDFNSLEAQPGQAGNCTVEGEAYHRAMAEKGWERESHKYCQMNCPAKDDCDEFGYYSKLKKDGRNAVMSFQHLFTTTAKDYRYLTIDEISYHSFVDIKEVDAQGFAQARHYVWNLGMQTIMMAINELLVRPSSSEKERLSGEKFYQALDAMCRSTSHGRGLLDLLAQAEAIGNCFSGELLELMAQRSAEAASKLPPNIWHVEGAEPGAGGIYDIIKEEARNVLEGLPMPFVSRLELIRSGDKPAVLMLYRRNYLSSRAASKPISVLDATGDGVLQRLLLTSYANLQRDKDLKKKRPIWQMVRPQVRTVAPKVEMPACVKVIQDTRHNFSKTALLQSLEKDPAKMYWNAYLKSILRYLKPDGKKTLLVCAKPVKEQLGKDLIDRGITEANGYFYSIENYGALRGTNAYKDYDRLVEAGMYMPEPGKVVAAGRALYAGDGVEDLDPEIVRLPRLYDYRHDNKDDGKSYGAEEDVLMFRDERLQQLLEVDREDEHLQVAHRIRPLMATRSKEIVLLFAIPLKGLAVDTLVTEGGEEINGRTKKSMDRAVDFARPVIMGDTNPFFTAFQMHEATGLALGTIYKYWDEMLARAGAESRVIECIQAIPGGRGGTRHIRRSLVVAAPIGTSPTIIKTLIILGEVPNLLPKGWRLASAEEAPLEAPALDQPIIESEKEVRPDLQGQVAVRLANLRKLAAGYEARLEADGRYSQAAALIRERYIIWLDELNSLIRRHASRGPRQQEVA
jgi:hypothetical protein